MTYGDGPSDPDPNTITPGGLLKYSSSDLSGSGTITPSPVVMLRGPDGLCSPLYPCRPLGIAMDSSSNLWVQSDRTIMELSPQQQQTGGSPLAITTLATNALKTRMLRGFNFAFGRLTFGPEIK